MNAYECDVCGRHAVIGVNPKCLACGQEYRYQDGARHIILSEAQKNLLRKQVLKGVYHG